MVGETVENANTFKNLTFEQKREIDELRNISTIILAYFPMLLTFAGIPSNIFIIQIVHSSTVLRNNFVSVFLVYLSLFNIINIVIGLNRLWLIGMFNFDIRSLSMFASRLHSFITMIAHMISNWILSSLSMCKLMYVLSPNIAFACCTKMMVHVFICIIILGATVFHYAITEGGKRITNKLVDSNVEDDMIAYSRPRAIIQAAVFFYIPEGIVHTLNMIIVLLYTRTIALSKSSSEGFKRHLHTSRRYAIVTLLIDIQFSVMEIPYAVYFTEKMYLEGEDPVKDARSNLLHIVATMMLYSNYCTNFIMYCMFGRYYRNQLKRLLHPCLKHCLKKDSPWLTTSSTTTIETESDYEVPYDIARKKSLHAAGSLKELYLTRPGSIRISRSMSRSMSHISRLHSISTSNNEKIDAQQKVSWLSYFGNSLYPTAARKEQRPSTTIY